MLIENKTTVNLKIRGVSLEPGESMEYVEKGVHDTLKICSDIGSCTIGTEYNQRSIKNNGELVAKEWNDEYYCHWFRKLNSLLNSPSLLFIYRLGLYFIKNKCILVLEKLQKI